MLETKQIYCSIRKEWIVALPEENVRQQWIKTLVEELGFPLSSLTVEKSLRHMPHLAHQTSKLPSRRADIIAFAPDIHPGYSLYPLLLIECKALKITQKMVRQVVGYNYYLQAPYIALVNQNECLFGWKDQTSSPEYAFSNKIPSYSQLMNRFG